MEGDDEVTEEVLHNFGGTIDGIYRNGCDGAFV